MPAGLERVRFVRFSLLSSLFSLLNSHFLFLGLPAALRLSRALFSTAINSLGMPASNIRNRSEHNKWGMAGEGGLAAGAEATPKSSKNKESTNF